MSPMFRAGDMLQSRAAIIRLGPNACRPRHERSTQSLTSALTAVKPTPKFGYLGEDFDRNRVDPPRTKGRGEAATGTKSLLVAQGLRACELEALAQFPEPKIDSYQRGYEAPAYPLSGGEAAA